MTEVEREPARVSTHVILYVHLTYLSLVSLAVTTMSLAETKKYRASSLAAPLATCYRPFLEIWSRCGDSSLPAMSRRLSASSFQDF